MTDNAPLSARLTLCCDTLAETLVRLTQPPRQRQGVARVYESPVGTLGELTSGTPDSGTLHIWRTLDAWQQLHADEFVATVLEAVEALREAEARDNGKTTN